MSKNVRAVIVYGNDTTLHIQMKKWDSTTASYIEFDMTTVKCLKVNLICEKHGTVIPLEYEIDETYNNILNCPINYELLHTGTSYGLVVEGVDENDANFRFEMLPKELFLVVSNTSGLKITDSLDVEGRVGWGINTGGDLTDYYTKEETDELLSYKASYTDVENKQDTLVSGENIKTINNISLLGSGNINIGGGGVSVQSDWNETDDTNPAYIQNKPDLGEYVTKTELSNATYVTANDLSAYASISYVTDELNTKQNTLESGVNIKTINNLSLLGSGNINIEGGGGIAYQVQSDWIDNNPLSYAYILNKPDLSTYATVSYVTNEVVNIEQVLATSLADFSTEIGYIKDDLNSYVTYTYLNSKDYLQSSDLNNYYTKSETDQKIADEISYIDLSSYATVSYVTQEVTNIEQVLTTSLADFSYQIGYITQDLSSYVTKSDLSSAGYVTSSALTDYPTFTDISAMSYITINDVPQVDLSSYATKSELSSYATVTYVTNELGNKQDTLISGTNIKTINNQSILGSGDITISGGGSVDSVNGKTGTVVLDNKDVKAVHDYTYDYLTFEAIQNTTFKFTQNALQYSLDDGVTWTTLSANTASPTVTAGSKIMWKQTGLTPTSSNGIGTFSATGNFKVYGNVMSLFYGDNFIGQISLSGKNYAFKKLFVASTKIINAKNLILPAITLSTSCYDSMFGNCSSLISSPELPATTLATYCYWNMFYNCSSLISAPELPATTLLERCYDSMFMNCSSLISAPELPATTLGVKCYYQMFYGCTKLISSPELPATTLKNDCYNSMFRNCSKLIYVPKILPATTLASNCYDSMFAGCTSLKEAPELPATTLISYCYQWMFNNCPKLNYIKCLATNISASACVSNWVWGVASLGTFIKASSMSSWTTGSSGIPTGWNVVNNGEDIEVYQGQLSNYTTVSDISAMSYVTSTDLSSASYVTSGDLTYYASSSTAGIKIEVVSAMPAQPVANTIYLVQAS